MKNIVIQGLGFVGSAMAVAVASRVDNNGEAFFKVTGVDQTSEDGLCRVKSINSGTFPLKQMINRLYEKIRKKF